MTSRLVTFALMFSLWIVLSGFFDAFHLTLGVICSALVTWWSGDLFEIRGLPIVRRFRQTVALFCYLAWQVVLSNFHLLRLALWGRHEVSPRIVKFRSHLKTDFGKFLLANSITLTPGTITLKIIGDVFYVHAISATAAAGLDGTMERRIAAVFETEKMEEVTAR